MTPSQWLYAHSDTRMSYHHQASGATMDWVAQSGDTLNQLARSFYPKHPAMQRLFVRQALKLNPHRHLTASSPLVNGEAIRLPSLKALSYASRTDRHRSQAQASTVTHSESTAGLPETATNQETYEQLLARNLKIQQQLADVLDKQVRLQAQMNALMMTLQQQADSPNQSPVHVANPAADAAISVATSTPPSSSMPLSDGHSQASNPSATPTDAHAAEKESPTKPSMEQVPAKPVVDSAPLPEKAVEAASKPAAAQPNVVPAQAATDENAASNPPVASQQADSHQADTGSVEKADATTDATLAQANPVKPPLKKSTVVIRPAKVTQASETNPYVQWVQFNSWSDILLWLGLLMLVLLMLGAGVMQLKKKLALRASAQAQPDWQPSVLELVNVNDEPVAKKSRMDKRVQSLLSQVGILISANKESEAQVMLEKFIQLYPKQSVFPWLYLLELHRSNGQQEAFAHVVEHLHTTFNVEKADWKDEDSTMVVESQLDAFPHIILELERIWKTDEATQYLKDLQLDKRDGERQGFSLEVLKEIAVLQNVLEIRALQSQAA